MLHNKLFVFFQAQKNSGSNSDNFVENYDILGIQNKTQFQKSFKLTERVGNIRAKIDNCQF